MTDALLVMCFACGVAALSVAAWLVNPAAGLAVAGGFLVAVPILYVRGRARTTV